jgi:hypothetical protein
LLSQFSVQAHCCWSIKCRPWISRPLAVLGDGQGLDQKEEKKEEEEEEEEEMEEEMERLRNISSRTYCQS